MSELVFLAHIPLLRIEEDSVPFMAGDLWRMPFEQFNNLTVGAFEDHRLRYDAAAPVFYRVVSDIELPLLHPPTGVSDGRRHALELKMPTSNWNLLDELGVGFMRGFQDNFVDFAWSALLLAVPAATFSQPRNSVCFAVSTTDDMFHLGEGVSSTLRVQGDADMEFVFLAEGACPPLSADIVTKASQLEAALERMVKIPELLCAFRSLQFSAAPALYPAEQLTQTVVALESLLLPEVKSGLGATFSRRLSNLLGANVDHRERLRSTARTLYDVRSAGLHGEAALSAAEADAAIGDEYGPQLLAAAVLAITDRPEPLDELRSLLDGEAGTPMASDAGIPLTEPPGKRKYERLLRSTTEETTTIIGGPGSVSLDAPEDTLLSWSPLVGLGLQEEFQLGEEGSPLVLWLTGRDILTLEDKDIRRDFLAQLNVVEERVATLAIAAPSDGESSYHMRGPGDLLRQRDLAVVALRLAGFLRFHDPELLGSFVYEGSMRYRQASVLRQTILQKLRVAPEQQIVPADKSLTSPLWELLSKYDRDARHPDIDNVLVLFRRSCDHAFLPPAPRAGFLFSALESMLGRSRPFKEKVQLDTLVSHIAGGDSPPALWFAQHGRAFRNSVAHGQWKPGRDNLQLLDHMLSILQSVIPAYVRCWVDMSSDTPDRPGRAFIKRVTEEASSRGA